MPKLISAKYSIGEQVSAFAAAAETLLSMVAMQESLTEDECALVRYYLERITDDVLKRKSG
ncbi:hypothetical protein YTPLAS18_10680 [Nitrospira sp.]|nr:hypothetical protein YTPLAS18_10680 [Nitrospira sp.]